jgi:hypothetical protein
VNSKKKIAGRFPSSKERNISDLESHPTSYLKNLREKRENPCPLLIIKRIDLYRRPSALIT